MQEIVNCVHLRSNTIHENIICNLGGPNLLKVKANVLNDGIKCLIIIYNLINAATC